jgi:hypothetical protein
MTGANFVPMVADRIPEFAPKRDAKKTADGWLVTVTPPAFMACPGASVLLTDAQYLRYEMWRNGAGQIQDLLSDIKSEDREVLLSGIGPDEWAERYPEEDDDE